MKIVQLVLAFVAITAGLAGLWLYQEGRQSLEWPVTKGHLQSFVVERLGAGSLGKQGSSSTVDIPLVRYSYSVLNQQYFGTAISLWDLSLSRRYVDRAGLKFVLNKVPLEVHYDPSQPSRAALIVGTPANALVELGFASLTAVVLALFLPFLLNWFVRVLMFGSKNTAAGNERQ